MAKKKRGSNKMRQREARAGYAFISIWLIGFIFLFLRPLCMAFYYSFQEMRVTTEGMVYTYVGFQNFLYKFQEDIHFFNSTVWPGLSRFVVRTPICVIFSLFIAIVLNQKFHGRTVARALFFLPVIITSGIVVQVLRDYGLDTSMETENAYLFSSNGIETILANAGLPQFIQNIFTEVSNQIFDIVWMAGIQILLYLSGLQGIPAAEYEAAKIEGATAWECFWKITWVRISPITLVVVVYSLIDSFTDVANPMIKFVYEEYSLRGNLGGSTALGLSYCLAAFVLIIIVYAVISKHVFYVNEN